MRIVLLKINGNPFLFYIRASELCNRKEIFISPTIEACFFCKCIEFKDALVDCHCGYYFWTSLIQED